MMWQGCFRTLLVIRLQYQLFLHTYFACLTPVLAQKATRYKRKLSYKEKQVPGDGIACSYWLTQPPLKSCEPFRGLTHSFAGVVYTRLLVCSLPFTHKPSNFYCFQYACGRSSVSISCSPSSIEQMYIFSKVECIYDETSPKIMLNIYINNRCPIQEK